MTDSPASLGTEMLQFNASSSSHPLNARKQAEGNLFTEAAESVIEFEDEEATGLVATMKKLFSSQAVDADSKHEDQLRVLQASLQGQQEQIAAAMELMAQHSETVGQQHVQAMQGLLDAVQELTQAIQTQQQHDASTPADDYTQRNPATGGSAEQADTEGF